MVEGVGFVGRADALSNFSDNIFNALGWWTRKQSNKLRDFAGGFKPRNAAQESGTWREMHLWKN